jgi:FkbH-like protein
MYETEANVKTEPSEQIPLEILSQFSALQGKIKKRTVLPWSEHCTECVWPTCYSTCDLYSPREDGRCRRFVDGMVRVECPSAFNHYLLKIRFKQWGKLWTPGNIHLRSIEQAEKIERRDHRLGTLLFQLPLPDPVRNTVVNKRYNFKKRMARRRPYASDVPTCFLLECFNPYNRKVLLSFNIRLLDRKATIPFLRLIELAPGFQKVRIPFSEIAQQIDVNSPFHMEIIPNEIGEEITLYFGLMEFVQELETSNAGTKKIKCVVWDLDNTLWDGILVEDGEAGVRLRTEVVSVISELDRRGILNSIASKNDYEDAMRVLKKFQIDQFFLCPQISWGPKGTAVAAIAAQLNIGADGILFVDDTDFELQQVRAVSPQTRVVNARYFSSILRMAECQVPVTAESMERRKMYQIEHVRQDFAQNFRDDYKAFLRNCDIQLQIHSLTEEVLERVHELTQRTNQMNFSGNRYDRAVLWGILRNPDLDSYVLSCRDRFGSYGVIGFGIVDNREPRLTDLMFSCRVQSKRVEHAFLVFLLRKYISTRGVDFHANYRKSPRNLPSGQVFEDVGMRELGVNNGVSDLLFLAGQTIPDDEIISIAFQEEVRIVG